MLTSVLFLRIESLSERTLHTGECLYDHNLHDFVFELRCRLDLRYLCAVPEYVYQEQVSGGCYSKLRRDVSFPIKATYLCLTMGV